MSTARDLHVQGPAVYAHRGSVDEAGHVGENTVAAFERARILGADGVELDVRMTADGAVAVCHDPVLAGDRPVVATRASDLPPGMCLLSDALDACSGMAVDIELKDLPGEPGFDPGERLARTVGELLEGLAGTLRTGAILVSSFWRGALETLSDRHPDLPTGLLAAGWPDPDASVAAAAGLGCRALHVELGMLSSDLVAAAHAAGVAVACWTARDRTELLTARSSGADMVITDDVALARDLFGPGPGRRV